jgi:hypothetical protein
MKNVTKTEDRGNDRDVSELVKTRDALRAKLVKADELSLAPTKTIRSDCHWEFVLKEVVRFCKICNNSLNFVIIYPY